jgi:hypothetical protein
MEIIQAIPPADALIRFEDISFTVERGTVQSIQESRIRPPSRADGLAFSD